MVPEKKIRHPWRTAVFATMIFAPSILLFNFRVTQLPFQQLRQAFIHFISSATLPELELSYTNNLAAIGDSQSVQSALKKFNFYQDQLSHIPMSGLTNAEKEDYNVINFQCQLNIERLTLEASWLQHKRYRDRIFRSCRMAGVGTGTF